MARGYESHRNTLGGARPAVSPHRKARNVSTLGKCHCHYTLRTSCRALCGFMTAQSLLRESVFTRDSSGLSFHVHTTHCQPRTATGVPATRKSSLEVPPTTLATLLALYEGKIYRPPYNLCTILNSDLLFRYYFFAMVGHPRSQ